VVIESDSKVMYSDNYFPLMPHAKKTVWITPLERKAPTYITVQVIDHDQIVKVEL